ncbi:alpha/beta hydrolase [Actinosynnema sp. ALI-1.44]|uniref:alpha/beta hydrolase family protein n=1 Tax=Actinosynnema sp. ALI-1.44 TaxID=1933779 RepID=UPI00097BB57F|nr:alpha/beta hydrolase [Actinosynnema sp. ALI-1.44]ONI86568.1 alpha/beta hydrolase [Actinosynnema sp. ALI-1.44]
MGDVITGTAAGVPYTALRPAVETDALLVSWHMIDAPKSDAAFAAALPLHDVPAWRVHLGLPFCGARMVDGSMDAVIERARRDAVLEYFAGFTVQAVEEFPAALTEVRKQLSIGDGPLFALGGSLGGLVALRNMTRAEFKAGAVVNALIKVRTGVALIEEIVGIPYTWTDESAAAADALDLVARAGELGNVPLLVVSGEEDYPIFREDAKNLADAVPNGELATIPGLAHPLAQEPGIEPAPQTPSAKLVDDLLTQWFRKHV